MRTACSLLTGVLTGVVLAAIGWYASASLVERVVPLWGWSAAILARVAFTVIPGLVGAVVGALTTYMILGRQQGTKTQ